MTAAARAMPLAEPRDKTAPPYRYAHRRAGKVFGTLFLLAFLSYGTGSALIESVVAAPDLLANVYANRSLMVVAALLMAVVHSFANIGLPVILLPLLRPHSSASAYGYLGLAITATVTPVVGAIFLLLLLPLADAYMTSGASGTAHLDAMAVVFTKGGFFSYQLGMTLWGLGGLLLCSVLYASRLTPRWLSLWGMAGYAIFIAGTTLELFGYSVGVLLSAPGGLFEVFLSLWLIGKGFCIPAGEEARP